MFVKDLKEPVTAIKLDWVGASTWMGFTPRTDDIHGRNKCTSSVIRQYGKGFVIEYITLSLQKPNIGFDNDHLIAKESWNTTKMQVGLLRSTNLKHHRDH